MKLYRSKSIEVEALQWTGDNEKEIKEFCPSAIFNRFSLAANPTAQKTDLIITNLSGNQTATTGSFIVKYSNGNFFPCNEDTFYELYEEVTQDG